MAEDSARSRELVDQIQTLVEEAAGLADPRGREVAAELLRAVMEFHGAALEQMMALVSEDPGADALLGKLVADSLVSGMLLLHDLHPDTTETRLLRAVERLQLVFHPTGADLELLSFDGRLARVLFRSSRAWESARAQSVIEEGLYGAAPELEELFIEGLPKSVTPGFVPLTDLAARVAE